MVMSKEHPHHKVSFVHSMCHVQGTCGKILKQLIKQASLLFPKILSVIQPSSLLCPSTPPTHPNHPTLVSPSTFHSTCVLSPSLELFYML